jgi:hypothetical protein
MSYLTRFNCIRTKCNDQLIVPIKLIVKGDNAVLVARCPACKRSYKYILPMAEKDEWLPILAPAFFMCDVCGTTNNTNWKYQDNMGHPYRSWSNRANRVRIVLTCQQCGKRRAKIASVQLWTNLQRPLERVVETPPAPTLKCPHCDAEIPEDSKICPSCKLELVCDKCGERILPSANFCRNCGDPVTKIEIPGESDTFEERICPTCNEEYEEGSIFCSVCGQELICDKCGTAIREGAIFCVNCGDEVTKGELSE